jgi:hypothetical protein
LGDLIEQLLRSQWSIHRVNMYYTTYLGNKKRGKPDFRRFCLTPSSGFFWLPA